MTNATRVAQRFCAYQPSKAIPMFVKLLAEQTVVIDVQDKNGFTAPDVVVLHSSFNVSRELFKQSSIDVSNLDDGAEPLHSAVPFDWLNIARKLINKGGGGGPETTSLC